MIAYLEGKPMRCNPDSIVILTGGVGYELSCSQSTLAYVENLERAKLWVHTHVREDVLQLFGFSHMTEKELFLSLVKVNGVGPKMAIGILSAAHYERLIAMIDQGDVKALVKLPKVGKKTAEQMVLTLKGKLVLDEDSNAGKAFKARNEIVSALVNLGFKLPDVEFVVDQMDQSTDIQKGVREGLVALTASV